MYSFLLFVHVLSAFFLLAMVVMYSAFALGGPTSPRALTIAQILDGVGGGGTIVFGVWLALYVDGYGILDGWIIAAIVLWMAAAETGRRAHAALVETDADATSAGAAPAGDGSAVVATSAGAVSSVMIRWHVIRTVLILVLLLDMVYKPGA